MDKCFGLYEAKVVDNNDPLARRRLKVRVHVLHKTIADGVSDASLPWARPCFPYTGPLSGDDGTPEIGAEIWVAFKHGDVKFPVWLGGYYPPGEGPTELATAQSGNVPKGYFRKTAGGWFYGVNEQTGVGKISSPAGYELILDETSQKATLKTSAGHTVELDEAAQKVTVQTAAGDKLELNGSSGEALLQGLAKAILDAATSIELGAGATEPAIKGTTFLAWLLPHTHNVTAVGSPTGPMIPNPDPNNGLSSLVKVGG